MGRRSAYAEYKAEVRRRVLEGATLATLRLEFGSQSGIGIPESTLQCWYRKFRAEPGERPISNFELVDDPLAAKFQWAEERLRTIAENPQDGDGIAVQAVNGYIRVIEAYFRRFPRSVAEFVSLLVEAEISPSEFMEAFALAHQKRRNEQAVREEFNVSPELSEELGF